MRRAPIGCDGVIRSPLRRQRDPEVQMYFRAIRLLAQRLPELALGIERLSVLLQRKAEHVADFPSRRLASQRRTKRLDCSGPIAQRTLDVAETLVCFGDGGLHLNRTAIDVDCFVEGPLHVKQRSERQVPADVLRNDLNDAAKQVDRLCGPTRLQRERAETDEGFRVRGMPRENPAVDLVGNRQAAGEMVLARLLERLIGVQLTHLPAPDRERRTFATSRIS